MHTSNYNSSMNHESEGVNLLTLPKRQKWTGAQIYHFIDDVQKQCELTSQLDLPQEVAQHYRDLLTRLVKTYGH